MILLDNKYAQIRSYLKIDVEKEYENGTNLFLLASDKQDFQRMTSLFHLGANIHPFDEYRDYGSPLYRGLAEYKRNGTSKLLSWYADIYRPLMDQDIDCGGGILELLDGSVPDEVQKMFGLENLVHLRERLEEELDDGLSMECMEQIARQQYRLFAPDLEPIKKIHPYLGGLAKDMDFYSDGVPFFEENTGDYCNEHALQPVPILSDLERVYRVGFASKVNDIKATLTEYNYRYPPCLRLLVTDEAGGREFVIDPDITESLLKYDTSYMDEQGLTEFQLAYRLLSASIYNWFGVHHYIRHNYGYDLFSFNSPKEWMEYRLNGIEEKDKEKRLRDMEEGLKLYL